MADDKSPAGRSGVDPDAVLTAFLDANVLYPALLRNVMMYLALARLYRPLWSEAVHAEWMTALRRDHPELTGPQVQRTYRLMIEHVPDAMVMGYESKVDGLTLPDAKDRHVLAAALHGGASVIVTSNLKHFPARALKPHGIRAEAPDAFLSKLVRRKGEAVTAALRELRLELKAPPYSVEDLLSGLERQKLPRTVALLRGFADRL